MDCKDIFKMDKCASFESKRKHGERINEKNIFFSSPSPSSDFKEADTIFLNYQMDNFLDLL